MAPKPVVGVNERSALLVVAKKFYLEEKSKVEIAKELSYSRFRVARMLEQAISTGVMTISFDDQGTIIPSLSSRLAEEMGLREAIVVESDSSEGMVRQHVSAAAADLLGRTLRPGEVLGIGWGRTISAMSETLPSLPNISVVQLTGSLGFNFNQSPVEIVRKVALRSGGSSHPIFAPMLVDNATTAAALRQQPDVAQAMRFFDKVTTAVLALGSWDPIESQLSDAVPEKQRDELRSRGVVAEVAATLIAKDGTLVATDFADLCIAATADQIRRIPRVLVVAAGARKAVAARPAIRAGLFNGIVTDRALAEALLATVDGQ